MAQVNCLAQGGELHTFGVEARGELTGPDLCTDNNVKACE
jgi:hypothetical protein